LADCPELFTTAVSPDHLLQTGSPRFQVDQSAVAGNARAADTKLSQCTFLGFRLSRGKLRWTDSAEARFKDRVRAITSRSSGRSMAVRIAALRRYVIGWLNYFGHSHSYREVLKLDTWLRRRVRMCYWKDWKRPRPRRRRLLALGADLAEVHLATRSRKGYWRMSNNRIVQQALSNRWLCGQGVPNMKQQWIELHYGSSST
jgi:RNA-directed DNA polymerase